MAKGTKTHDSVAIDGTADEIRPANQLRSSILLRNTGAVDVYVGNSASVTTANGFLLQPTEQMEDTDSLDAWYGITGGGAGEISYIEVTKTREEWSS